MKSVHGGKSTPTPQEMVEATLDAFHSIIGVSDEGNRIAINRAAKCYARSFLIMFPDLPKHLADRLRVLANSPTGSALVATELWRLGFLSE